MQQWANVFKENEHIDLNSYQYLWLMGKQSSLTLSSLNLLLSSLPTTSRELLSQFSTCSE